MSIQSYEDLLVWQKSMELVSLVYAFTKKFPLEEMYGLSMQMRRSSISIPSNIAEGSRRGSRKDFRYFLTIAYGSGAELETQIKIAKQLQLGVAEQCLKTENLLSEVMPMLNKLIRKLQ